MLQVPRIVTSYSFRFYITWIEIGFGTEDRFIFPNWIFCFDVFYRVILTIVHFHRSSLLKTSSVCLSVDTFWKSLSQPGRETLFGEEWGVHSPQVAFPPAEGHGGQLSSLRSAGTQVQPGRRSCFHKGSSLAVLCVYTLQLNWFPAVCLYSVVHCIT